MIKTINFSVILFTFKFSLVYVLFFISQVRYSLAQSNPGIKVNQQAKDDFSSKGRKNKRFRDDCRKCSAKTKNWATEKNCLLVIWQLATETAARKMCDHICDKFSWRNINFVNYILLRTKNWLFINAFNC